MDSRPVLPVYVSRPADNKRFKNGPGLLASVSNIVAQPRRCFGVTMRFREKYVALCALIFFLLVAFWNFSSLPDQALLDNRGIKSVLKGVLDKLPQDVDARDLVLPRPMDEAFQHRHRIEPGDKTGEDVHVKEDRRRFEQRLNTSFLENDQIPLPILDGEQRDLERKRQRNLISGESVLETESKEGENEKRRETVKQMMIHAWDNYKKYAWGANELRPISKVPHRGSVFGGRDTGATIIDALDTLYIMGLMDRFDEGKKFVEMSFRFSTGGDVSVFETTIRFVGGLLACYALTKDNLFKEKAVYVADLLLPAFNTPTGIPYSLINVDTKMGKNYFWASGGSSILSEFGTLHLEFEYLSAITNNSIYSEKVRKIRDTIKSVPRPTKLFYNYLNPITGNWGTRHVSMGALGDSFYEYLLKAWVMNKTDEEGLQLYEEAMTGFQQTLFQYSKDGLFYIAESKGSSVDAKMDHLACFAGGMFALYAQHTKNQTAKTFWDLKAAELTHTCHESYIRSETHLGPESFRFTNEFSAKTINDRQKYYILRPEVIEAYFYLWRTTKDQKYRDWAWDAVQAIEKHCRTPHGYSGIQDVYSKMASKDDVQQSFFLAETLKYLYLIFSPDDVIPLDRFVFNTEAHPLPIFDVSTTKTAMTST